MLSKMRRFKSRLSKSIKRNSITHSPRPYQPDPVSDASRPLGSGFPTVITPAQEVLSTSELLDLIFCYLPPSTLVLSAKGVCRTWYSVLSKPSPALEVALFLRPAPEDSPLFTTPTTNDLLAQFFPFWLMSTKTLPKPGICSCSPNMCGPWTTAASVPLLQWKLHPAAWQNNNPSSWRKWQLVQPPCKKLDFWKQTTRFHMEDPHRTSRTRFKVDCPDGVTLGIVCDIVEGWIREAKDEKYTSEYEEVLMMQGGNAGWDFADFVVETDRGKWGRKELYMCDTLDETDRLLFLHLDLDKHSLSLV